MRRWWFWKKSEEKKTEEEPVSLPVNPLNTLALDPDQIQAWLKKELSAHDDVHYYFREWVDGDDQERDILLAYCEGMIDKKRMNQEAIPVLKDWLAQGEGIDTLSFDPVKEIERMDKVFEAIFKGELVVFIQGRAHALSLDVSHPPQRQTSDSPAEPTIRGARDGLTESLVTNISLVRKRLCDPSFCVEKIAVGTRSHNSVALLYIKDVVHPPIVYSLRQQLQNLDVDHLDSSAALEKWLTPLSQKLFPVFDYTARPDFITAALLRGRVCILLDGSPAGVIAPIQLTELLKSEEDNEFLSIFPPFQYLLRWLGLVTATFFPGFFIALTTFHQDQIPFPLLSNLVQSEQGVPLPAPLEAVMMVLIFELFKEAGLRLPGPIGQTLSVVGGLIIGDAAIRSGLTSPSMVVAIAISVVASFTLDNLNLNGIISILRLIVLVASSLMGLLGLFICLYSIVLYLSWLRPFGLPYLAPIAPLSFQDFLKVFTSHREMTRRPSILQPGDPTRKGEEER
ncbi:spore germination protein [Marininema halotolerans]|uniref:GerA spore germination protein n=1 Tax=Marininema halotolerans TaxID=1155944 RepID=A0A1I6TYQ8_9BACL|nr:spore germination protein [Marininema halotolerans]SFS94379.1 GerA spore germination protein [Marininema halotolerans]